MATIVSDELKELLISKGMWSDFSQLRADIRAKSPKMTCKEFTLEALHKYINEGKLDESVLGMVRDPGRPGRPKKDPNAPPKPKKSLADAKFEAKNGRNATSTIPVFDPESFILTRETFAHKECPYMVALNWAYSNLRIADVSPLDAPSAVAWNLLMDMRESPSIRADLIKGWSNAESRKSDSDLGGERFDGADEYDFLADMGGKV